MKQFLFVLFFSTNGLFAQEIPNITLENLDGEKFTSANFVAQSDKPILVTFWATWCIPCLNELSLIDENYEDWKQRYQFDFYAISVDDDRTVKKVQTLVKPFRLH